MGSKKVDLHLCQDVTKFFDSKGYTIFDVQSEIFQPESQDDYPKVVKKSEIILEHSSDSPSLDDLCVDMKKCTKCEHATIVRGAIHAYQRVKVGDDKKSPCVIELVKICYDA